jgi:hypothetical protein
LGEIVESKLYGGEVTVLFNEDRHTYTVDGEYIPSSTGVTGVLPKDLIPWAAKTAAQTYHDELGKLSVKDRMDELTLRRVLETAKSAPFQKRDDAGFVGGLVHDWIKDYVKFRLIGVEDEPQLPSNEGAINAICQFKHWVGVHDVEWLFSERVVMSRKHGFTGTADLGARIDGLLYVVDFKTGKYVYRDAGVQVAAYCSAIAEELVDDIWSTEPLHRGVVHIGLKGRKFTWYDEAKVIAELTGASKDEDFAIFLSCLDIYHWTKKNKFLWQTWRKTRSP